MPSNPPPPPPAVNRLLRELPKEKESMRKVLLLSPPFVLPSNFPFSSQTLVPAVNDNPPPPKKKGSKTKPAVETEQPPINQSRPLSSSEPPLLSSSSVLPPADLPLPAVAAALPRYRSAANLVEFINHPSVLQPRLQPIELTQERLEIHRTEFRDATSTEVLNVQASFLRETVFGEGEVIPPTDGYRGAYAIALLIEALLASVYSN